MTTTTDQQTSVRYDKDAGGIVTLTLDDPTASANTMNDLYVVSMAAAVDRLYDEADSVTGVVVTSAKKTFFAGANLNEMVKAGPDDAQAVFELAEKVKASLRRLETFPKPVAAAINGAALGELEDRRGVGRGGLHHVVEVGAGEERLLRAGDDDARDRLGLAVQPVDGGRHRVDVELVHGVGAGARVVEG